MSERWTWLLRYIVVIILALIVAAALADMELFRTTRIGKSGLNAARIVQFFGYGGALWVLWLLASRATALIPPHDERWSILRTILVPLATLVVVACGQALLLLILEPLMNKTVREIYNWIAIAAIVASAAWLLGTLLSGPGSHSKNHASRPERLDE